MLFYNKASFLSSVFAWIFLLFLITPSTLSAQTKDDSQKMLKPFKSYVTAFAQPGDGVLALLRRYNLGAFTCNEQAFYHINKMKKGRAIQLDRIYKLPIYLYTYNDTSIRTTIGYDNWQVATRIKKYNRVMKEKTLQRGEYEETGILWVPHHEVACQSSPPTQVEEDSVTKEVVTEKKTPTTTVPPTTETPVVDEKPVSKGRNFPIFGKKYAHVPLESDNLRGKVFYIVSGHGGPDPGAIGKSGKYKLCEDEYAYDVALRLTRQLIANGATAYMITRDNDGIRDNKYLGCDKTERCWKNQRIPANQKARLTQRADAVNTLYEKHKKQGIKSQTLVSVHIDSRSVRERADIFFYYLTNDGARLAKTMQKTIKEKYAQYQKGRKYTGTTTSRDLFMLRETKPTAVYIELGNIRNSSDQKRFIYSTNREALAKWLYDGLVKGTE
ncbi:MAG: N-acetylmuramoyl-L-alanine amidase family protein [Chitinophagales bacterium]